MTDRSIKSEPTRERILKAAEALFAERGFAGTSVQDIAAAADANRALLFYYFKNKQQLFDSLLEDAHQELLSRVRTPSDLDPREALRHAVRGFVRFNVERTTVCRLVMKTMVAGGEPSVARYQDELLALLGDILQRGMRLKLFRKDDPRLLALSLIGMITVFFRRQVLTGQAFDPDVVERHTLDLFLRGAERR